ncbi:MAG: ProQ/FinO family protein [Burkholderiales bacterium]|nr:ProQ/FinO family protein [Burkholderiales bacterium]
MSETPLPPPAALPAAPDAAAASPSAAPAVTATVAPATAARAPVADCTQQLKQLFPALFTGAVKPLKLRIQVDIQERAPGTFTKPALSAFFRRHTGSTSYLIAVSRATHRFDLDGQPTGEVSAEHRQGALDELARRRANQQARIDLEEQQRRNRAGLLHDFQTTTLTPANFCALKGVAVDELDGLLALARSEAEDRTRQAPARSAPGFDRPRRAGPPGGGQRPRHSR